ncbi:MAG: hypothetical protein MUD13_02275, partial [Candidatus Nanopelagicales bacterium]|nr:hypothetical protein [Candidatus Nanopelagicales bacterium]
GSAYVGVNIDTRAIPDPAAFLEHLRAGFDAVLAIADPTARAELGVHSGEPPAAPEPAERAVSEVPAPATQATATRAPA